VIISATLINVNKEAVKYHLRKGHIVQWLRYIGEGELAERLTNVTEPEQALQVVREYLSGKGKNKMRGGRRDDPLPAFWAGFHAGGLGCYSLCGVIGFVAGVVEIVGYRPTGSSDVGKTPFRGHHPKHQTPQQNWDL
jgi:hypothetical protein